MRICFICKRYYTNKDLLEDKFGRLYHLPLELNRMGDTVEVNAIDYRNADIEKYNIDGVIFRSIPATMKMLFLFPFRIYRNAINAKPDIIIASGDSHIGFLSMLIAKIMNVSFIFDVYDYYPDFIGNKIPGMKTLFRHSVKGAQLVLCASKPLLEKLLPLNANRLLVENGVDLNLFAPDDMLQARSKLGLSPESLLVGYFGSIDRTRGPLLIEACRKLRHEFPALRLIMSGRVVRVDLKESWITHYGELSQSAIPTMINACDVVTIPYANTPFNSMCGACKIAEYLACGKPVVATRVSDHARIFADASFSLCDPTPESMAEALRRQFLRRECATFPRHLAWSAIGTKLHNFLQLLPGS